MKRKHFVFVLGATFLIVSVFLIYDTVRSYGEIRENNVKIEKIEAKQREISNANDHVRRKIDRFSKDPRAAEEILRKKYDMLRKDQYKYIPKK